MLVWKLVDVYYISRLLTYWVLKKLQLQKLWLLSHLVPILLWCLYTNDIIIFILVLWSTISFSSPHKRPFTSWMTMWRKQERKRGRMTEREGGKNNCYFCPLRINCFKACHWPQGNWENKTKPKNISKGYQTLDNWQWSVVIPDKEETMKWALLFLQYQSPS